MLTIWIIICSIFSFEQLKQKDKQALTHFYNTHKETVLRYLLIKARGDVEVAEEVLCATFHSALEKLHSLKYDKNIGGWLIKIAASRFIDYHRKQQKEKQKVDRMKEQYDESANLDTAGDDEQIMVLEVALAALKGEYQQILKLKYYEQKSQKEIAKIINKNESAVVSLLHRARQKLKKEMERKSDLFDQDMGE